MRLTRAVVTVAAFVFAMTEMAIGLTVGNMWLVAMGFLLGAWIAVAAR